VLIFPNQWFLHYCNLMSQWLNKWHYLASPLWRGLFSISCCHPGTTRRPSSIRGCDVTLIKHRFAEQLSSQGEGEAGFNTWV